jgi:hypothetical protein
MGMAIGQGGSLRCDNGVSEGDTERGESRHINCESGVGER